MIYDSKGIFKNVLYFEFTKMYSMTSEVDGTD